MKMVSELTNEQYHYYVSTFAVNEDHQAAKAIAEIIILMTKIIRIKKKN